MAKKQNALNIGGVNPADPKTQALGMAMLESGQVTPEEVQAAQVASNDPKGAFDWLTGFLNKSKGPQPFSLGQMSLPDMKGLPSGKNVQKKSTSNEKQDTKMSQTKNLYADPEEYAARIQSIEDLPFIQDQKKGISEMENALSMQEGLNQPPDSDYWIRPLISLTDSMTGSKLMNGYKAPVSQADRNQKLLAAKDDLLKRKGDLSKQILEGVTKMKEGSETNSISNQLAQMMGLTQGSIASGGGYGDPDDRRAFQAHQSNMQAVKKDVNLRQNLSNMQRIENGLNNAVGVEKLTNQSFHELQQAIRSSITKGSGGVDERADTYYKSLGMNAQGFMQFLNSTPQNLNKNDPFVKHVLEIGRLELENIKRQNMSQVAQLTAGHDWVYDDPRYAKYKTSLDKMMGAADTLYTPQLDKKVEDRLKGGKKTKGAQVKGPSVEADLGKMTDAQLQEYISTHGG